MAGDISLILQELQQFMNDEGQVISWPAKPKKQLLVLQYLAEQFKTDEAYTEKQVNEILNRFHTFSDAALLRRELYMKKFLDRTLDGSRYWKMK